MTYFTKEENKRLEENIKNNAVERKDNMLDYYKNNDIKEIIKDLEGGHLKLNGYVGRLLLDYITNLQKAQETLIKNDNEIITNLQEENINASKLATKLRFASTVNV